MYHPTGSDAPGHSLSQLGDECGASSPRDAVTQTPSTAGSRCKVPTSEKIAWNGQDDPDHPLNWNPRRQWRAVLVVSLAVLTTSIASAMVTPNVPAMAETLNIRSSERTQLIYSIFALSYAVGPLIFCPISEQVGRYWTIVAAMTLFSLGNLVCGVAKTATLVIAARFFSGMGGHGCQAIAMAVLSDTFSSDDRLQAISVYGLFSITGMTIGPILGAICSEKFHWRTLFHGTSILDGVVLAIVVICFSETYPPTLLRRRAATMARVPGGRPPRTEYDLGNHHSAQRTVWLCIRRSAHLLLTQPMLQFIAVYYGLGFGLSFIIFSVFPSIWTDLYGQTPIVGSLNFLWLGAGCLIPSVLAPWIDKDLTAMRYCLRGNKAARVLMEPKGAVEPQLLLDGSDPTATVASRPLTPELRWLDATRSNSPAPISDIPSRGISTISVAVESELALSRVESERRHISRPEKVFVYMFPAAVFLPLGLFLFGYSVRKKWHPFTVNFGAALVGFASTVISFAVFKYLGDAFPLYEASAIAAVQVTRAVTSCVFPVFSRKLFATMGYDGGTGILAIVSLIIGLGGTSILFLFGGRLRLQTWRIPHPWANG